MEESYYPAMAYTYFKDIQGAVTLLIVLHQPSPMKIHHVTELLINKHLVTGMARKVVLMWYMRRVYLGTKEPWYTSWLKPGSLKEDTAVPAL